MASSGSESRRLPAKSADAALTPLRMFCAESPIIPAIRKPELVERAIATGGKLVYLLSLIHI